MGLSILFLVQTAPYKSENPKLALTHALAGPLTELHIDEEVKTILAFVGDGVLNCIKDQKSMEHWDITSTEQHLKNLLLSDVPVLVCKEDLERFGISKDRLVDATEMGAEISIEVVPFSEIQAKMEEATALMCF
jgi:sulfur relay (sulfurtransferase) DsrF/TusC family protein